MVALSGLEPEILDPESSVLPITPQGNIQDIVVFSSTSDKYNLLISSTGRLYDYNYNC